ncbi:hypothetical protein EGR_01278 [Echinococcus granulosus]|uniref:Uncharacterized protein n=1 Tax=Echinococcus granulosus TaxID=6210 RepID=W6UPU9_ECHGR|nr:hypothetical protein EGR_01278 [Echinococcus granulosus]EUB63655.1 hypothetical protein EGR_01278 [Echinococcus granulosus]
MVAALSKPANYIICSILSLNSSHLYGKETKKPSLSTMSNVLFIRKQGFNLKPREFLRSLMVESPILQSSNSKNVPVRPSASQNNGNKISNLSSDRKVKKKVPFGRMGEVTLMSVCTQCIQLMLLYSLFFPGCDKTRLPLITASGLCLMDCFLNFALRKVCNHYFSPNHLITHSESQKPFDSPNFFIYSIYQGSLSEPLHLNDSDQYHRSKLTKILQYFSAKSLVI